MIAITTKARTVCGLCSAEKALLVSHVMPAFIFKWLKNTSMTGHIRFAESPNRRVQDGFKFPFLCAECEQLLNSFETPFATLVFHPYETEPKAEIPYQKWMLRFCVSVSWRILECMVVRGKLSTLTEDEASAVASARETWKRFLLGETEHPGVHEQHLLPLGLVEDASVPNMPANINRYFMRTADIDAAFAQSIAFTYAKLGPFALFGFLKRPPHKWGGTKIHVTHGLVKPRKYELPPNIMDYLFDRARNCASIYEQISDTQHDKIESVILKDIDRAVDSKEFEAMLQDANLFGEEAVLRKRKG